MKTIDDIVLSLKASVIAAIQKSYKAAIDDEQVTFEKPPKKEWGEFSFPTFSLAKLLSENPAEIANVLAKEIEAHNKELVAKVDTKGPYVNIHVNRDKFSEVILQEIHKKGASYGNGTLGAGKRIMIEYSSPNTNKPQHLGHVRNDVLGYSISLLEEKIGYEAVRLNLIQDRGIHIMQPMVAYKKWGEGATPESANEKPDHFVGKFYVMFSQRNKKLIDKALEDDKEYAKLEGKDASDYKREVARNTALSQEAYEMLRKWEAGDPETLELWKKMKSWTQEGWEVTYKNLGVTFDDEVFESDIYNKGKELVFEGIQEKVFEKDEKGRVIARLGDVSLPDKILLRADGTTIYITQDLYLAKHKFEHWNVDASVYVVASEQDLHFKQLFAILKKLGYEFANERQMFHRSYGMVNLPDGRMKSREGTVVDGDDVIEEIVALAKKKAQESETSPKDNIDESAHRVGMGALKFFMLSHAAKSDITYDPKQTIAFEGYTGPFVQYSHARARSVLRKAESKTDKKFDPALLIDNDTFYLTHQLSMFPQKVIEAATLYDPSIMAQYVFEVAQLFNTFYHANPILKADDETKKARLFLVGATAEVLKNGLELLGIEAPEEM